MTASYTYDPHAGAAPLTVVFTDTSTPPTAGNVTLLAHFFGSNGSTSFVDNSSYNRTMSIAAGAPSISTAQFRFSPSSLLCPATGTPGSVKVDSVSDGGFIFPGDFTIECYAYYVPSSYAYATMMRRDFNTQSSYWLFRKGPDDKWHFDCNNPIAGGFSITSSTTVSAWDNQWVHLAVCRVGTVITMYANGQPVGSGTYTGIIGGTNPNTDDGQMRISQSSGGEYWSGYIGEVRINKGYAYYDGAFTPPNAPLTTSGLTITNWLWDFSDGYTSTTQNPVHVYTGIGEYNPSLTITYSNSGTDSVSEGKILVSGIPQASFDANPNYGIAPLTVYFNNTSSGFTGASYLYHFGDGTTSTDQFTSHEYAAAGRYPAYLSVASGGLVFDSPITYIGVRSGDNQVSYYAAEKYNGVQIKNDDGTPMEGAMLYSYAAGTFAAMPTYGPGEGGANPNPLLTSASGYFETSINLESGVAYRLVLTKPDGTTVISEEDNVINGQIGVGNHIYLSGSNPTGMGEVTVNCIYPDPAKGHGQTYLWWVTSTNPLNMDGSMNSDIVAVSKLPTSLTTVPDVSFAYGQLYFHRAGSYTITTNWSLAPMGGEGNPQWPFRVSNFGIFVDSAAYTPRRVSYNNRYSQYGMDGLPEEYQKSTFSDTWTVSVNANEFVSIDTYGQTIDNDGSYQANYSGTIMVNRIGDAYEGGVMPPYPQVPVASFIPTTITGDSPLTVHFTDTSTSVPPITFWYWDFGDGDYSNDQNPTHEYTNSGPDPVTYQVYMQASNWVGDSNPAYGHITVTVSVPQNPPVASFTPTAVTGYIPYNVAFTDTTTNNPTGWNWNFGDGNTSTAQNPSHLYTTPQQLPYHVTLTAYNAYGSSTAYGNVTAWGGINWGIVPVPSFTTNPANGDAYGPTYVEFTDTTYGLPTSWFWDFGDGIGTSYAQNPQYTYANIGTYTVSLTTSNEIGTNLAPATMDYVIAPHTYHLYFMDDTGAALPLYVDTPEITPHPINGPFVARSAVQALVSQLNGFAWPRPGDPPGTGVFNNPPEPESTDACILFGRNYFFWDGSTHAGRWLYLRWTITP